jgi:hypothetical protein
MSYLWKVLGLHLGPEACYYISSFYQSLLIVNKLFENEQVNVTEEKRNEYKLHS